MVIEKTKKPTCRDRLLEIESILGDMVSDIEGLRAMGDAFAYRPAVAVINDLESLIVEAKANFDMDGVPIYDSMEDTKLTTDVVGDPEGGEE